MEALKQSIIDNLKIRMRMNGCETCRIWKKEVNTLQAKLDKTLQPKVTFAINTTKYNIPYCNHTIQGK